MDQDTTVLLLLETDNSCIENGKSKQSKRYN